MVHDNKQNLFVQRSCYASGALWRVDVGPFERYGTAIAYHMAAHAPLCLPAAPPKALQRRQRRKLGRILAADSQPYRHVGGKSRFRILGAYTPASQVASCGQAGAHKRWQMVKSHSHVETLGGNQQMPRLSEDLMDRPPREVHRRTVASDCA